MKNKIIAITLAALIVAAAVLTFTACDEMLSGTYVNTAMGTETSYYFRGDRVTVTVTTVLLGNTISKAYEGEYEITTTEGGVQFIEFDFETNGAALYEGAKTFSVSADDGAVTIGGIEYLKKK